MDTTLPINVVSLETCPNSSNWISKLFHTKIDLKTFSTQKNELHSIATKKENSKISLSKLNYQYESLNSLQGIEANDSSSCLTGSISTTSSISSSIVTPTVPHIATQISNSNEKKDSILLKIIHKLDFKKKNKIKNFDDYSLQPQIHLFTKRQLRFISPLELSTLQYNIKLEMKFRKENSHLVIIDQVYPTFHSIPSNLQTYFNDNNDSNKVRRFFVGRIAKKISSYQPQLNSLTNSLDHTEEVKMNTSKSTNSLHSCASTNSTISMSSDDEDENENMFYYLPESNRSSPIYFFCDNATVLMNNLSINSVFSFIISEGITFKEQNSTDIKETTSDHSKEIDIIEYPKALTESNCYYKVEYGWRVAIYK